ncbi:hypothetical protein LJC74_08380 [Eubacteriales bacterium OttesenSCG-928-A19]|nr:hypothetical protein [Eubacteriales bacterium OttesenSCG-928-A19]
MLACAQITIRDENDIHVGAQPPAHPAIDQLWLDSSVVPNILHRWNGVIWEKVGQDFDTSDYYTIEEVNTRFDLTNEEIALKADKTVTDSLGNRLSDTESKLTVQAGQITSAVSTANTALANYNNLQLGGRNYIIGSNQMIERSDDSPGNKWFTSVSLSPAFFEDCQGVPILLSMDLMSEDVVHGERPSVSVVITYEYEDGESRQYSWNWQHLAKAGINRRRRQNLRCSWDTSMCCTGSTSRHHSEQLRCHCSYK